MYHKIKHIDIAVSAYYCGVRRVRTHTCIKKKREKKWKEKCCGKKQRGRRREFENIFWGSQNEFRALNDNILQTIIIRIIKSFFFPWKCAHAHHQNSMKRCKSQAISTARGVLPSFIRSIHKFIYIYIGLYCVHA